MEADKKKKVEKKRAKAPVARAAKPRAKKSDAKDFSIPIYDMKGKEVGTFSLDKKLFDGKVNTKVLYYAVNMYNANARQGNAATKTRGDVSGGGKKPWRQKGTGRARAGSTRSPLWRHGGVIFGPHPRDFGYEMPKKTKRLAFLSSVNSKLADNKLIGLEDIKLEKPKTKLFKQMVDALKITGKSLFIVDKADPNTILAARNLKEALVRDYKDFNTMDVLRCDTLVLSKGALEKLPERFK